jgi:hypothetical protein
MTLQEAKLEIINQQYIIGEILDEAEITHIVIVPNDKDVFIDIIQDIVMGYEYEYRLIGSSSFSIYVLFDMDDPNQGFYSHLPLHTALARLQ